MDAAQALLITQLLIYTLGWATASLWIRKYQATSRDLAFSAFCFAVYLLLSTQEPATLPAPFLAAALPEFFKAQAFLYASSACTAFFNREALSPPMQRWLLAILLSIPAALTGPDPYLRHGVSAVINTAIVLVTAQRVYPAVIAEFGRRHAHAIRLTGFCFIALLAAKALWQQGQGDINSFNQIQLLKDISFMLVDGILYLSVAVMLGVRLVRETQELAIRDPLTGLLNRRGLEMNFAQLQASSAAKGQPYSLLLIDIDHFKRINDSYGHGIGDQILQQVAAALRKGTRASDASARMGGEEFLLVLSETEQGQAFYLAERLRERLARRPLRSSAGNISITISIGLAQCMSPDESLELTVERADRALYMAKASGRNRVAVESEGLSRQPVLKQVTGGI